MIVVKAKYFKGSKTDSQNSADNNILDNYETNKCFDIEPVRMRVT